MGDTGLLSYALTPGGPGQMLQPHAGLGLDDQEEGSKVTSHFLTPGPTHSTAVRPKSVVCLLTVLGPGTPASRSAGVRPPSQN